MRRWALGALAALIVLVPLGVSASQAEGDGRINRQTFKWVRQEAATSAVRWTYVPGLSVATGCRAPLPSRPAQPREIGGLMAPGLPP